MNDSVKTWAIGTLNQKRALLSRAVTLRTDGKGVCERSGVFASASR